MSLRRLRVLAYATVIAVILLGATSLYALKITITNLVEVEEHSHLVEGVAELQGMFNEVIMPGNDYLITASEEEKAAFQEVNKEFMTEFATLEKQMEEHAEERAVLVEVKEEYLEQIKPLIEQILALENPVGNSDGMRLMKEMDGAAAETAGKLEKIHKQIGGENEKLINKTEALGTAALAIVTLLGIFVITVAAITAYVINKGLIKPILALAEASEKVAEGDISHKLEILAKGEIGQLTESFKVMISNLRSLITTLSNSAQSVAATSEELASNSNEAARATQQVAGAIHEVAKGSTEQTHYITNSTELINQVNNAIEQIATGAGEQVENVNATVGLVGQMARSIQEVAEGAQTVAVSAGKTKEAADQGAKAVNLSIKGMEGIKVKVFESADKIKELGEHSEQIGQIIQVIDDIAEQTNLLALNAAIEAARAGEHGKGFAVVADEVRKLAERSGKATKEIAELITNIQKLTAGAVTAMEEGTVEVEQGALLAKDAGSALAEILSTVQETYLQVQSISAAAEQISSSSNEVVKAIDKVSSITEENSAATEQITAASQEVATAMQNVSAVSQEASSAVEEVSASTEELNASLEEISSAADNLANMAEELKQSVIKFKL